MVPQLTRPPIGITGLLICLFALLLLATPPKVCCLEEVPPFAPTAPKPGDDKKKSSDKVDKPKGPEHNVTLLEEAGAMELFNRAKKARARAEKDPEVWPECVKAYADILKKYAHTVYLDKWEGPDKSPELMPYENGLYKSTRERVMAELATLPESALAVYRITNEPAARAQFLDAQEQFDERKMEQVSRDFFLTGWGDDAQAWLGEFSYENTRLREALARLKPAVDRPGKTSTPVGALSRTLLAAIQSGDKVTAEKTLETLTQASNDPKNGALRAGHDEGPAALQKLKSRVAAMVATAVVAAAPGETAESWETYYGNAAHNKSGQPRTNVGLRKWSVRIDDLLYGTDVVPPEKDGVATPTGEVIPNTSINQQLTATNGYFYLNDGQVYAAYPIGNPRSGMTAAGGNALFQLPLEGVKTPPRKKSGNPRNGQDFAVMTQHPYFATLANGRSYGVLGTDAPPQSGSMMNRFGGRIIIRGGGRINGGDEEKLGPSNYLCCFGSPDPGKETALLWSLKPGEAAYNQHSKEEQDWLRGIYFVCSPTYDSGVLYAMAMRLSQQAGQSSEAWNAAFDATNGRMLWRTQICSGHPASFEGRSSVQPDWALPVAVANRTVYSVTNLGAVAALDAGTGSVKWIRIYDRIKMRPGQQWGQGEVAVSQDFWAPNAPIVFENRLIVTPQDSSFVYAYDTETGARIWQTERFDDPNEKGLRHVLGIVDGVLVLSGTDLRFLSIRANGKRVADYINPGARINGRGAIAGNTIFLPTDSGLVSYAVQTEQKVFKVSETSAYKFADPTVESGSVYLAGGVLFTVSHTHVNAYFVWEELEAKLKDRLKANPDDVNAHLELADVYKSIERPSQALIELEAAQASADKQKADAKMQALISGMSNRKFEAYIAIGSKAVLAEKPDEALDAFAKAYDVSQMGGSTLISPVLALKARAEIFEKKGDLIAAANEYQIILAKHGDALCQFQPRNAIKSRLFAQSRLALLREKNPAAYAAIDTAAKTAFDAAGADAVQLEAVIRLYPNSDYAAKALLAMAENDLEKSPESTRMNAQLFLGRSRDAAGNARALALLATASERLGLLAAAREALSKLSRDATFKDISLPRLIVGNPGENSVAKWAGKRLDEPIYKSQPSNAVFSLGGGKLKKAWEKTNEKELLPMLPDGIPPANLRQAVFYIDKQNEISAVSGRDGSELWSPRPQAPAFPNGRAFWRGKFLIVGGENALAAYDASNSGKIVWTHELGIDSNAPGYWSRVVGGRILVAHSGALMALDALTGDQLWNMALASGQLVFPPVCGDGFVAIAAPNSNKLVALDLDTGAERWNATVEALTTTPVAEAGIVCVAQRNNMISLFDGRSGKKVYNDIQLDSPVTSMRATETHLFLLINRREVAVYRLDGNGPAALKEWRIPDEAERAQTISNIAEIFVDGDDLLVVSTEQNGARSEFSSFSIRRQGALNWKSRMASDASARAVPNFQNPGRVVQFGNNIRIAGGGQLIINQGRVIVNGEEFTAGSSGIAADGSGGWMRENATREHLVLMQSVWDIGGQSKVAALLDRKSGKAVWDANLKSEGTLADGSNAPSRVQLFDGGLVLFEPRGRTGFTLAGLAGDAELKELAERAGKNADDIDARLRLAVAEFEKGAGEKVLKDLAAILSDTKLDETKFATVYAQFARIRREFAEQYHATLPFVKVDKALDVSGGAAGWEQIPGKEYKTWLNTYLSSEDLNSRTVAKQGLWTGEQDQSATFKGAYDDQNLYIQITVTDNKHSNIQTEGSNIDLGDSLVLAFDIGLAGGIGYRGETFELQLGLGKNDKALGWRKVEHGRYLRGQTPLEKNFSIVRKEDSKQTVYQIAVPLAYLGMKPETGVKFGFTFAVLDQDEGTSPEKAVCPSPGLWGTRMPKLFPHGVLGK